MQSEICKNCEHVITGNFCCNCGQTAKIHEIDLKYVLHEIPHSALHIHKGIFFTIISLFKHPGNTILDFINGKRVRHFPPLTFVILMASIYVAIRGLQIYFGFYEVTKANDFVRKHQMAMFLTIIPLFAFFYWLFHRKYPLNFWQILVAQTFLVGQLLLIVIIPNLLFFAFPEIRNMLKDFFFIAGFGNFMLAYYQIYSHYETKKVKLIFREIICFFVSFCFSLGIAILVFGFLESILKK